MKRLILIDGNNLMFRAYYATAYTGNLMMTKNGLYTNALFGFANMVNKIVKELTPDYLFIAFDKGKKTFRHQMYGEYKSGRAHMPEELAMQIPLVKEYVNLLGIKQYECNDYEADDLVGSCADKFKNDVDEIIVISQDKDLLQLVDEKTTVASPKSGISELIFYNTKNFKELLGIEHYQMVDYKGLIGDSSDNLPGVTGVGPKTAQKLLEEYKTLENIFDNIPNIKGKISEKLSADKEVSLRTKMLATLVRNVPLDFELDDLKCKKPEYETLRKFYERVEFTSFIKKMNSDDYETVKEEDSKELVEYKYNGEYYINDIEKLEEIIAKQEKEEVMLEVELDGENYHKANLLGISLLIDEVGFYFEKELLKNSVLKNYLEKEHKFSSIDVKRVYCALEKENIHVSNFLFDFILGAYILNPVYPNQDLHNIFNIFFKCNLPYLDDIYGKKSVYQIPELEVLSHYSIDKCYYLSKVINYVNEELENLNQTSLLYDMELPLAIVLAKTENNGFKVNKERLLEIGEQLEELIKELEKEIYMLVGHEFNISSPKQLGVVLFEELELAKGKKTKTGYSTSADVLEKLAYKHEVVRKVLEYRKYTKLYSTYVVGLTNELYEDSKVRTTFKQALTLTGRLSSTEPNIQNIPIRTEDGRLIRSAFVSSFENGELVSADYSQIELRILAAMSNCKGMLDAFNNGIDLHTSTAAKIYDLPEAFIDKDMRRIAKAVNFGIVYGMSDWGLSEELHISPLEAKKFIEKYYEAYPEIRIYLDNAIEDTKNTGYSKTIFNRRRYMPDINSSNHTVREFAKRTAMNAPIQGSAADVIKLAMVAVDKEIQNKKLNSKIVAQVHDELIVDCPSNEVEIVKSLLKEVMENTTKLDVKLEVSVESGKTWDLK